LYRLIAFLCFTALLLGYVFADGLIYMVGEWQRDEYSHGYIIPLISFWVAWENRESLKGSLGHGSWAGVVFVLVGLLLGFLGEVATLYIITQYAFLVTIFGLCLAFVGWQGMRWLWFSLLFLVFMIPLPSFLYNSLSSSLQLISSKLGVEVIRLFDISVNLQGNVIDLGTYQLQVVEACSGLRYLFALCSFSLLCAYFFRGKFWMKAIIFLTSIPITIFMNSFRIGVVGVLVEYWGIEMAEGFLHDFEGWIIFVGCLGILFLEMWLMVKLFYKERDFSEVFVISAAKPDFLIQEKVEKSYGFSIPRQYLIATLLVFLAVPLTMLIGERHEQVPDRKRLITFPMHIDNWRGNEVRMEQKFIDRLKFDDYLIGNFSQSKQNLPVNLYIAYYASQRKGASVHSPKSCIPGGGWKISGAEIHTISGVVTGNGKSLTVNRVVISKGEEKQLVYYWFQQRGRYLTNEYFVKWFLFWDALTRQRTDGALVRLVIALPDGAAIKEGDKELGDFTRAIFPLLNDYLPI
jgi:exosortase D (VPLPA-CTERM-specific)